MFCRLDSMDFRKLAAASLVRARFTALIHHSIFSPFLSGNVMKGRHLSWGGRPQTSCDLRLIGLNERSRFDYRVS